MLRITWILPGGCALLAIVILALSFRTLDRPHSLSMPNVARTRFAVIDLGEHPEWRQFLVLSADRRANELNKLREVLDIKGANDVALPVQAPIATPDENHPIGIQEDKLAVPTLPEDTRASVEEEKPAISALEEKPIAADQRANELNSLREMLDIKDANDVASDTPVVAPRPANRNDSDPDESNVLSMQLRAADTGASTPVRVPIATSDENHAAGIQEDNYAGPTLPEDTRASVQEEKPTVSVLEDKRVAIGSEKSTKVTPGKKSAAIKIPQRVKPRAQSPSKGVQHVGSRARAPSKQNPSSQQYFFDPFGYQPASQTSPASTTSYFTDQQARPVSTPKANQQVRHPQTASTTSYFTDQQVRQVPTPKANQQLGRQTPTAGSKNSPHTSKKTTAQKKIVQKRT